MSKRDTPFLLCEAICEAVRQRLPETLASDTTFFFDYEGLAPVVTIDHATVQTLVDRLLRYSFRTFGREGMFFRVKVVAAGPEACRVHVRLATIVRTEAPEPATLTAGTRVEPTVDVDLDLIQVLCRLLGGQLSVQTDGKGAVVEADFLTDVLLPILEPTSVDADGASAWLVSSPPFASKMLARRLQRLGWQVRLFETVEEVEAALQSRRGQPPALVIGSAHRGVTLEALHRLSVLMPGDAQLVLQVLQRSAVEGVPDTVQVQAVPLSPRRLLHYTELARLARRRPSGDTQAGALEVSSPPLVLVVDDNEVNRTLGEEMVRMLGFRAMSAAGGQAAITLCQAEQPGLVLMDLQMPGMDGFEATRRLREAQASGELPPFAVLAVSAATEASLADRLHDANSGGFDAYVPKPIDIPTLRRALQRWLPAH